MNRPRDLSIASPLIVVVDDDAGVRNSLKFSLEIEGYSVQTYASPNEALAAADFPASACLIVDQNMPGMSGLRLVAALRDRGVHAPAILVSGRVTSVLADEAARDGVAVVEKPFVGNVLVDCIRTAIAQNSA